jgi:hypothetical protein
MHLIILLAILCLVAGCGSDPVRLRHPQTGETVQCWPYHPVYEATERGCIEDYQRQGYERVME